MKKKMSLKMLAATSALGLAFAAPALAQNEFGQDENEVALAIAVDESQAVAAQDDGESQNAGKNALWDNELDEDAQLAGKNAVLADEESQAAGNDALWVENEAEEDSQAGVAGNDVKNTRIDPEADAEDDSLAGVAGNDVNQTQDSQLAGNDAYTGESEAEGDGQAGVAGNDLNQSRTEENSQSAVAGNDVKQVKVETKAENDSQIAGGDAVELDADGSNSIAAQGNVESVKAENDSQIAGGDATALNANGSNGIAAEGDVKSVKAENDSQIAGGDAIRADRGSQVAGGDASSVETDIEIEAEGNGSIAAGGDVIKVEAKEDSIAAGGDVKTVDIEAEHGSVAGGFVKVGFMAVNEGILEATVEDNNLDDSSTSSFTSESNYMTGVNVSTAGIAQAAQNSGTQSVLQQNVSVQGNLNFRAASILPIGLGPVNSNGLIPE